MATMDEKEKMHKDLTATQQVEKADVPEKQKKKAKSFLQQMGEFIDKNTSNLPDSGSIMRNTDVFKKGGKVSGASKRADGCAVRGKTKGRMV